MKHWYRLREIAEYKIAKVVDYSIPTFLQTGELTVCRIENFVQAKNDFRIAECLKRDKQLHKSMDFVNRRYFNHPSFDYIKYGVSLGSGKLFVVLRVQPCNGVSLLRVIDCIGDHKLLQYFTPEIDNLLIRYGCEYVDCYETGVEDSVFLNGGWKSVVETGNIMPDYFAPFEQRNIDIHYMSEIESSVLFKGDGDMDRPN